MKVAFTKRNKNWIATVFSFDREQKRMVEVEGSKGRDESGDGR